MRHKLEFCSGGYWIKKPVTDSSRQYVMDANGLFHDDGACTKEMHMFDSIVKDRPVVSEPSRDSTVWDWALIFCIDHCWHGRNEYERDMFECLMDSDFHEIADAIFISEWENLKPTEIYVFGFHNMDHLARSAMFWAYKHGFIDNDYFLNAEGEPTRKDRLMLETFSNEIHATTSRRR